MAEVDVAIKNNLDLVLSEFEKKEQRALKSIGMEAEGDSKELLYDGHGVDTGRLRNSITYATESSHDKAKRPAEPSDGEQLAKPEKGSVYIGTNVEYARFVHEKPTYSFLRCAISNNGEKYKEIYETEMKS